MPTLMILRHAKSTWTDSVRADIDRPLNDKGRRAAASMGAWMAREDLAFDLVIASPATRVRQTIEGIIDGYGQAIVPMFDTRVYMASAATLAEIVQAVPAGVARLLLIGHNPGLEELVMWLVPDCPERADVEQKYPTASLAEIAVENWAGLAEGGGKLLRFTRPRDLDPALGPDEDA